MGSNYKVGDKVMIAWNNDNDGYKEYRNKTMIITDVYYSEEYCLAYDKSMNGMGLFRLELPNGDSVGFMLYEYEIRQCV